MSIATQIERDFIKAYKDRDLELSSTLRLVKSALKNAEIAAKNTLSEDEEIKILRREMKQRDEAASEYERGGRSELAEKERREGKIISAYLPEEVSDEEIEKVVSEVILELSPDSRNFGKIMGLVMGKIGKNADGSVVARIVKQKMQ